MTRPATPAVFESATLSDFDWAEADLCDAIFIDCAIEQAQMSATVLRGARFERCRVIRCRLAHADLTEASFKDCQFADPDTHQGLSVAFSHLAGAQFQRCDLSFSAFDRCDLHDISMEDCNLRGARLHRCDFSKSFGRKVVRTSAKLRRCNFHLADLSGLVAPTCDLSASLFREADLSGADLEQADLSDADLFGAILQDAKLAHADLRRAEISGLDLASLATRAGLKITPDQQFALLTALGIDVRPD